MKQNTPTVGKERETVEIDDPKVGEVYQLEGGNWNSGNNDYDNGLRKALVVDLSDDTATVIPFMGTLDAEYNRDKSLGRDTSDMEWAVTGDTVETPSGDTWELKKAKFLHESGFIPA